MSRGYWASLFESSNKAFPNLWRGQRVLGFAIRCTTYVSLAEGNETVWNPKDGTTLAEGNETVWNPKDGTTRARRTVNLISKPLLCGFSTKKRIREYKYDFSEIF